MQPKFNNVIYKETDGISIVSLNRPEKLNSITTAMGKEIIDALNIARASDSKVVILKGEGRAFSAGADLKEVRTIESTEGHRASILQLQDMARIIINMDKPVIAAVQGYVVAGGLELALDADFLIAADDVDMFCSEPGFGGMVTNASHQIIPRLVGLSRAKEMVLLGRHIDAKTALDWGLVNRVVPRARLDEAAIEMAKEIVKQPRIAVKLCRIMLNYGYEMSFGAMLELELSNSCTCHSSDEHKAGVAGMVKKLQTDNIEGRQRKLSTYRRAVVGLTTSFLMGGGIATSPLGTGIPAAAMFAVAIIIGASTLSFHGVYTTLVGELADTGRIATTVGAVSTIQRIGMIIMPPLFGKLVDVSGSYDLSWRATAALALISTLAMVILVREPKR